MLSREDNELLTRVEGDAPMGRMIRQHWWVPAGLSAKLVADGAPVRVRLFGANYVAFRSTDGRVGFFDEACPHRGASMALARNEDNALRCIYHGWKFSVEGVTVAVPTQPTNEAQYCKHVPLKHYPVHEEAGIFWVWLGDIGQPPAFQNFGFCGLPEGHAVAYRQRVACNWVQAVETTMDSAHLGVLHQSFLIHDVANAAVNQAPVYEIESRPYGFRYAAVRELAERQSYVRTNSFVLPWYAIVAPRRASDRTRSEMFFPVPIDDHNTWYWHISFVLDSKVPYDPYWVPSDRESWPPACPGDGSNNWGQDREAMRMGHFSGFPQSLGTEDFAVITSMGPIVDRTKEYLGAGDRAVLQVRRCLLDAVRAFIGGDVPQAARHDEIDYAAIRPIAGSYADAAEWRSTL